MDRLTRRGMRRGLATGAVLLGLICQQVENYLFSPRIMSRTMSVHPAVGFGAVVVVVVVGATLFGPFGALVSVPVVAAAQALAETYGHRYELVGPQDDGPVARAQ